ncbi:hypothetical protein NM688_g2386 [Phlebia brevispora]|uniref:Uncharacterized protein n=1 Tax=Phlebia brevispora TaxID=194682 RepID=A0ACC1T8H3_9APHY|nr:hypothetical protein NM688_g2386 [Phlebia brevispora]
MKAADYLKTNIDTFSAANGHASSKYVVEQFLARAAEHGLQVTSLRVGQVCGSNITGAWNTTDWVPIIVKSSMAIGCMPELDGSRGTVDIQMPPTSRATYDVIQVFWCSGTRKRFQLGDPDVLLEFLHAINEASKLKGKAAVETDGFPFFQTSELEKDSGTARLLPPIDKSHATMWASYWKQDGYLA